jgi:hypothetical protein
MRSLGRHAMNAYGVFPNGPFVLFLFILVAAALAQSQAAPEKPQSELGNDLVLNRENMERDVWARAKPLTKQWHRPILAVNVPALCLRRAQGSLAERDIASPRVLAL